MKKELLLASILTAGLTSCSVGPGYYLYEYWVLRGQRATQEELSETVKSLEAERNAATSELARAQSELRAVQRRIEAARSAGNASSLRAAEAERDRLRREVENMEKQVGDLQKQIKEKEEDFDAMQ